MLKKFSPGNCASPHHSGLSDGQKQWLSINKGIFLLPLAKRKEAQYNMTEKVKSVIFNGDADSAFTDYEAEPLRRTLLKEARRIPDRRNGTGTDPDGLAQGADRRFVPAGAGNAGMRRL